MAERGVELSRADEQRKGLGGHEFFPRATPHPTIAGTARFQMAILWSLCDPRATIGSLCPV
jgi:hypothetical protein